MTHPPVRFALSQGDKDSAVWRKLKVQLETMLQQRRESNDEAFDENTTAHLRGEIMILKWLLDLDTERKP